ncbi:MAG: HEAT repeat domain-containing protein [Planctomycetota bacterium]
MNRTGNLIGQMSRFANYSAFALLIVAISGCAEGMLWRTGQYAPWVREQWAAEEQIADTLFERKRGMNEMVAGVQNGPADSQAPVASRLTEIVNRDPILLMRIHATSLLGDLNCPTSISGLADASSDNDHRVRLEAVRSWSRMPGQVAVPRLQEMIGSDTNIDVRLAATTALGNFPGQQSVQALSLALEDRDPAMQLKATESLAMVTGEEFGPNVQAWQQYVNNTAPVVPMSSPVSRPPESTASTTDSDSGGAFRR